MRKITRSDSSLDFVRPFSSFCETQALPGYGADMIKQFVEQVVGKGLTESVAKPHRIEGVRAEMMFQTVVAALGEVKLLKAEDAGDVFCEDGENVAVPDFTIVTQSGDRLLVEVKLHTQPLKDLNSYEYRISDKMMQSYLAYAKLVGGELMFGIFWQDVQMWTLNTVRAFRPGVAGVSQWSLSYAHAMPASEMHRLGDFYLAVAPPLRFRLYCNPQPMPEVLDKFSVNMKIERAEILSREKVLTGPAADFVWRLMNYGSWPLKCCAGMVQNGMLIGCQYIFGPNNPEVDDENPEYWTAETYRREETFRDLAMFASLSTLISRQYLDGAGSTVHTLSGDPILQPGGGKKFIPDGLEILVMQWVMQPNYNMLAVEASGTNADAGRTDPAGDA